MGPELCVAALEEAIARHGRPDIFNTDQGSQFTVSGALVTRRVGGDQPFGLGETRVGFGGFL
jgi:putative transposase